jgi:SNF2 family DNA or RNA helicase
MSRQVDFYHDTTRNLLIYRNTSQFLTDQLRQAIPEAREINGHYLAVPRNLHTCQVLRHFQYPVPPVLTDSNYSWPRHPSIGHPYESQKLTTNFMILHPRCFVLSDMGVGKTLSTLWAADAVMRMHKPGTCRALIVCPLSIMQRVWSDGIFKNFLGARTVEILHGDANRRLAALTRPADFYIVNFDGVGVGAHTRKRFELDGFSKALAERNDIKIAICDEASAYKDSTTKRHRIARLVFGKRDYLWMLTGTPTPNAPTDAYGLAKLVNNAMGKSNQSFKMETMYRVAPNSFKWVPRRDGYEKARALLKPSIRFEISDVWDGPELTTQQREVELTAEQKKLMADLKKDFVVTVKSGAAISAVNEAAARIKFVQISLGAIYDQNHRVHTIDAGPRHAELIDVLEQAPGKSLIFVPLTSVINIIYSNIKKKWNTAIVNGEVSQKERSEIFRDFQDGDLRVIVADASTMAHGLDLYAARTVIWHGPTEKPELYAQANARAMRPGQKFPVTVVQLVSNPLEREIFRRLENNLALQGALLDLVKANAL